MVAVGATRSREQDQAPGWTRSSAALRPAALPFLSHLLCINVTRGENHGATWVPLKICNDDTQRYILRRERALSQLVALLQLLDEGPQPVVGRELLVRVRIRVLGLGLGLGQVGLGLGSGSVLGIGRGRRLGLGCGVLGVSSLSGAARGKAQYK
eukprot:scaffold20264_cov65-Phaeocystis_antarctica.AAC.5